MRKIEQSAIRGGELAWIFKSFNPPKTANNWANEYVTEVGENTLVHSSTYLDVPRDWLGQPFIDKAEHLKEINPEAYEHEYGGVANGNGGMVFEYLRFETITDEQIKTFDRIYQGVDWGFYPDPYAFIRAYYNAAKETIYLIDENYVNKQQNAVTAQWIKDKGYTVKPRLEQAGADCEKISVIDEKIKSLSMIDERLEEAVIKTGAKLLILDPIQAYLGGGMDMNRANEARDMTKKLAALAEKYQCAIVLVGHMNKAAGNKAAYRGMGSIDFFAVARSVLLVGRVEGEENIRAVVQIKNNLAAFGHPKAFALSEDGFQWLGDYEITADEVLGGIAPKANKMEQAKRLLRELAETNNAMWSFGVVESFNILKHG